MAADLSAENAEWPVCPPVCSYSATGKRTVSKPCVYRRKPIRQYGSVRKIRASKVRENADKIVLIFRTQNGIIKPETTKEESAHADRT